MLNKLLANAILCYRHGKSQPITMSPGTTGQLYIETSQHLIQERLSASEHRVYCEVRDISRAAVSQANQSQFEAASASFSQALKTLSKQPVSEELRRLGASRIAQARAYLTSLTEDWDRSRELIHIALKNDEVLEADFGYALFHVQRIHLLHLLLRVEIGSGQRRTAVQLADQILQYLTGNRETLPVGGHWSTDRADAIPDAFRNGMIARTTSEIGILLAKHSLSDAQQLWTCFPSWRLFEARDTLSEIFAWGQLKDAYLREDREDFLQHTALFLAAGRCETLLWYTTVLDLCGCCQALRPAQTAGFRQEVAQDAARMRVLPSPYLPSNLRRMLQSQDDTPISAPHAPRPLLCRRFHAYNVGLPRTGTSSVATLFGQFRSATEFQEQKTVEHIVAWQDGSLSEAEFHAYILDRDREGQLEMDSASFNHFYLDFLIDRFPEAKFVFTIRECYPWLNSFLSLMLRWRKRYSDQGLEMPPWMAAYGRLLFGTFSWDAFTSADTLKASIPDLVEPFVQCWSTYNRLILERLPPERSLIIPTEDLSHRQDDLAAFIGVPRSSLSSADHVGRTAEPVDWLQSVSPAVFEASYNRFSSESLSHFFRSESLSVSSH